MRILSLVLLALIFSGCASSRMPDEPLPLVTLTEVNRALDGRTATVRFADARGSVQGRVTMGPVESVIRDGGSVLRVPTGEIEAVYVDVSMSPAQGALHGGAIGAAPGTALALAATLDSGRGFGGQTLRRHVIQRGLSAALVGLAVGTAVGTVTTNRRDDRAIYQAPITRYPDAALALLENEEAPAPPAVTESRRHEEAAPSDRAER